MQEIFWGDTSVNVEENSNRGGWGEPSEQDPDVTAVKGGKAGRRTGQEELQPGGWGVGLERPGAVIGWGQPGGSGSWKGRSSA